jgi:hypothetical protein
MDLRDAIDEFLEEAVVNLYPPEVSAELLLSEHFVTYGEDGSPTLLRELVETVTRRTRRSRGHIFVLARRGRPNAARSMKAKLTARRFASKRSLAQRKPSAKRKRKQAMLIRRSMVGGGRHRGHHGTIRHAAPRIHRHGR